MKLAQDIYKRDEDNNVYLRDYKPMLETFGKIIIQVDDEEYQGDSRVLYFENNKYGYLNFGWGSCSGCDALQACDTLEDVQSLMDELYNNIMWFKDKKQALNFFEIHDWEGDYSESCKEQMEFVNQVKAYLKENYD